VDGRDPSEELYALARRYWTYNDTRDSESDAGLRDRALEKADLSDAFDLAYDAIEDEARYEDFLVALIDTRRNDNVDLNMLGEGWVEQVWHNGDHDILDKLRHRETAAPWWARSSHRRNRRERLALGTQIPRAATARLPRQPSSSG
jgi:hypothetical protein